MPDYTARVAGPADRQGLRPEQVLVITSHTFNWAADAAKRAATHLFDSSDVVLRDVRQGVPADDCGFHWHDLRLRRPPETARSITDLPGWAELEQLSRRPEVVEYLDELVHEIKAGEAAKINNGGVDDQLRFIAASLGVRNAVDRIVEGAGVDKERPDA